MTSKNSPSTPIWENVEAQIMRSSLTQTEHILRGGRSHLFLLLAGSAKLHIKNSEIEIEAPVFVWVPQGISSKFTIGAGTRGISLSIPELQLGVSLPAGTLGSDVREVLLSPIIKKPEQESMSAQMEIITNTIHQELYANEPATQDVVRYNLTLLMIQIWRATTNQISHSKALPISIFQNFVSLVELHVSDHWTVANYADHIGVSVDRLTSAVKRATGRTPLAEIHRKIMQEAEQQLFSSSHQISEIAYKLGFKDAAYFNRFFQKQAGMPPGKYRKLKQEDQSPKTYAAWP